jgi:hypothetical protein
MSISTKKMNDEISKSEISVRREGATLKTEPGQADEIIKTRYLALNMVKKIIVDCLLNTTMHGPPSVISAKHLIIKIMWIFFMLASAVTCSYLVIKSIQDFFQYEVVTVTSSKLEIPTLFPVIVFSVYCIFIFMKDAFNISFKKKTVTICNYNPFLSDSAIQFAQTILTQNGLDSILNDTVTFPALTQRLFFPRYFVGISSRNPNITDSVRKAIFMSMEQ